MHKIKELQLRCSLALDFLHRSVQDGELISETQCSVELKLKTISLLFFCGDFFDKDYLFDSANQMLDKILEYRFDHAKSSCIIKDDQSFTNWQAAVASILFKTGHNVDAVAFMETLRESIKNSHVEAFYLPGTHNEQIERAPNLESPLGILALTFILANKYFDDVGYESVSRFLGNLIITKGRFDALDIWSMRLLNDTKEDVKYKQYSDHVINRINSIATVSMSSLVAAVIQQTNLAWIDKDNSQRNKIDDILDYQFSLQDMKTGAFQRTPSNAEIRIDYVVQNIIAFILYLGCVEGQEVDTLKLLT